MVPDVFGCAGNPLALCPNGDEKQTTAFVHVGSRWDAAPPRRIVTEAIDVTTVAQVVDENIVSVTGLSRSSTLSRPSTPPGQTDYAVSPAKNGARGVLVLDESPDVSEMDPGEVDLDCTELETPDNKTTSRKAKLMKQLGMEASATKQVSSPDACMSLRPVSAAATPARGALAEPVRPPLEFLQELEERNVEIRELRTGLQALLDADERDFLALESRLRAFGQDNLTKAWEIVAAVLRECDLRSSLEDDAENESTIASVVAAKVVGEPTVPDAKRDAKYDPSRAAVLTDKSFAVRLRTSLTEAVQELTSFQAEMAGYTTTAPGEEALVGKRLSWIRERFQALIGLLSDERRIFEEERQEQAEALEMVLADHLREIQAAVEELKVQSQQCAGREKAVTIREDMVALAEEELERRQRELDSSGSIFGMRELTI